MHLPFCKNLASCTVLCLAAAALPHAAPAADFYWSGAGAVSDNIDQGDNWFNGGANPSSGDNLYFNNTTGARHWPYCNYGGGAWFGNLVSYSGAGGILWRGDKTYLLKLENNSDPVLLQAEVDLSNRTGPDSDLEINPVGSGGIQVSNVVLQNARQLKVWGGNTLTISGVLSESGSPGSTLAILQGATVILNRPATLTGDALVNAGTLRLSANNALANSGNFVRLGDTSGAAGANLNLDGGLSLATPINVRSGSSGTKVLANTVSTSGTATFAGNLSLDNDATIYANAGGALAFSGTTVDLKNQTLTVDGPANTSISGVLANSTGSGKLLKNGTGTLTLSGANTYSGATTIGAGKLQLGNAAALGSSASVSVAAGATLDLAGFSTARPLTIAGGGVSGLAALYNSSTSAGATLGTLTLSADATMGGAANVSAAAMNTTGIALGGFTLTLNSGRLTMDSTDAFTSGNVVANNGAVIYITGGTAGVGPAALTLNSGAVMDVRDCNNSGQASVPVITLNGGEISNGGATAPSPSNGGGGQSNLKNAITVGAGGGVLTGNNTGFGLYLQLSGALSGSGALTLAGGKGIELVGDLSGYTGTATMTAGTLSFNGSADQTFNGVLAGTRSVVKNGSKTLSLSNVNTYTGTTTVNAGAWVGVTGGSCAGSAVTVGNGATNGVQVLTTGGQWTCASLTCGGSATDMTFMDFNFGSTAPSSSTAPLLVNGNLALTARVGLSVRGTGFASTGTYPLIKYTGTLSGTVPTTAWSLPSGMVGTLANNTGAKSIDLVVTAVSNPSAIWAVNSGVWDINTTANWTNAAGSPVNYLDGSSVLFNTPGAASTITLNTTVTPAAINGGVTFNNSGFDFTLSGSGAIAGAAGLTKSGTSELTLATANSYSGGTLLNSGTLRVAASDSALGSGLVTVFGSATVATASGGGARTLANAFAINPNQTLTLDSGFADLTLSGGISGAGALTKANSGTVTFSTQKTYTGATTVNGGILDLTGGGGSSGTIRGTATVNAGATLRLSTGDATGYNGGSSALTTINVTGGMLYVNTTANQTLGSAVVNLTGGAISGVAGANLDFYGGASALNTVASGVTATISGTKVNLRQANGVTFTVPAGTTPSGVDLDVSSVVSYSTGFSGNKLVKAGTGVMRLSANNSYAVPTLISAGKLIGVTGGACSSSMMSIASSAALGVQVMSSGGQWTCAGLTNVGTGTVEFNFYSALPSTTTAPLQINGDLVNSGTLNVTIAGNVIPVGVYPLIKYTGSLTAGTLGSVTLPGGAATLVNNSANKTIDLNVTLPNEIAWQGNTGNWDVNSTANWTNASGAVVKYIDGSAVRFDDSSPGTAPFTVTLGVTASPANVTVNNPTKNYTISGAGAIGGGTALTKSGAGTLTLIPTTANTYSGGTTINAGSVNLGNNGNEKTTALGTGPVTINSGGTLGFFPGSSTSAFTISNSIVLNGGKIHQEDGHQHLTGPIAVATASTLEGRWTPKSLWLDGVLSGSANLTTADGGNGLLLYIANPANTYSGTIAPNGANQNINIQNNTALQYATIDMGGYTASLTLGATNATPNVMVAGLKSTAASKVINADATYRTLTVSNPAASSFAGTLGDSTANGKNFGLFKTGAGTLTLSGANTFTGKAVVSAGTLSIAADSGLGTAPGSAVADQLTINGGTLAVTAATTLAATRGLTIGASGATIDTSSQGTGNTTTIAGIVAGTGPLTLKGNGDLSASGGGASGLGIKLGNTANTFTGDITITGGLVSYAGDGAFGNAANKLILNGGGLIDNNLSLPLARTIQVNAGGGVFRCWGSATPTWSGALTGSGNINRTDGGVLTLSGSLAGYSGTYSNLGGSTVLSGTAATIGGNWTLSAGSLTVNSTATQTLGGLISGSGSFVKNGPGYLTLSGANPYTGSTTVSAGTLEAANNASGVGKAYTVAAGATLKLGYATSTSWGGGNAVTVNGTSLSDPSGLYLKGGLSFQFGSTLTLQTAPSTVRTYGGGAATLNGGDVNNTHLSVASSGSGSVLDPSVNISCSSYGYRLNVAAGANTATGDLVVGGVISGSGSVGWGGANNNLLKYGTGSLKLTGANTLTKGVWVENGSMILSGGDNRLPAGSTVSLGDGSGSAKLVLDGVNQTLAGINVNGTGTANAVVGGSATTSTLTFNNATMVTYPGMVGGTGANENNLALAKAGAGALTLPGLLTYTGNTTISAGTLQVDSLAVVDGATLSVVDVPGTLAATNLHLGTSAGSLLAISGFAGAASAPVVVTNLTVDGVTTITLAGAFTSGQFPLIQYLSGTIGGSGSFTVQQAGLPRGVSASVVTNEANSSIDVVLTANPLVWTGTTNGVSVATWDKGVTTNWSLIGAPAFFTDGDNVQIDDTATGSTTLTLAETVSPFVVLVTNSTKDFTLNATGDAALAGSMTLLKQGPGVLTLASSNAFSGGVVVNGGAMKLQNSYAINTNAVTVTGGAELELEGGLSVPAVTTLTLNSAGTNETGGLRNLSGNNLFAGPITLNAAATRINSDSGTLTLKGGVTAGARPVTLGGSGNIAIATATVSGSAGLFKDGSGTNIWNLNPNISGGGLTVNTGTLQINNNNFAGTFTPSLTVNQNSTLLGNSTHATGGGAALTLNRGTWLLNAEDYKQNLVMVDGLIGPGPNTFSAGADLRVGYAGGSGNWTWFVSNSIAGSVINAQLNTIGAGVGLTFNVTRGTAPSDLTINGPVTGGGSLSVAGDGIVTLTAANTATGPLSVNGGKLVLTGSLAANAVTVTNATLAGTGLVKGALTVNADATLQPGVSPGETATLTVSNTLNLGGTLFLALNRASTQNSARLAGMTALTCGGALVVTNCGPDLQAGDTFTLFSADTITGAFASLVLPPLNAGLAWDTNGLPAGRLAVYTAPIPGVMVLGTEMNQPANLAAGKLVARAANPAGYPLTVSAVQYSGTHGSSVSLAAGVITYTPGSNYVGSDSFTYTLSDGHGWVTGTVNVTVNPPGEGYNRLSGPTALGNGDLQLSYAGIPNYSYALDWTPSFASPVVWTPITTNQASAGGALNFTVTPVGPSGYYRTRYVPAP